MEGQSARFLVIGAGVNGSTCATILRKSGIDVTLMARGSRLEELREDGIVIEDPMSGERSVVRVDTIGALEPDDIYDYILVVMRKNQALELLPILARNKSPNVVFMGNTLASPDEYGRAIGPDRVMLGSVYTGGRREGRVIRAFILKPKAVPFGEIDGSVSPRLRRLVHALNRGASKARISTNIVDRLLTHAALIPVLGIMLLKHGCDNYALSKSRADLALMVAAMRESLSVIRAVGYRLAPRSQGLLLHLPRFATAALARRLLGTRLGEVGAAYHVSQAPDEMRHLAHELEVLLEASKLPAPALRAVLDRAGPSPDDSG
jgi:2-dehydropantoate 2-reductase